MAADLVDAPPFTVADVRQCAISSWYPLFAKHSIPTVILPAPSEFVDYLLQDSVVLPEAPPGALRPADPRFHAVHHGTDDDDDDDGDSRERARRWADADAEAGAPAIAFHRLELDIARAIDELGGRAFPKMSWSAPKVMPLPSRRTALCAVTRTAASQDAEFIGGNSLQCTTPGHVFLLLKSSDIIASDIEHAFVLRGCDRAAGRRAVTRARAASGTVRWTAKAAPCRRRLAASPTSSRSASGWQCTRSASFGCSCGTARS